MDDGLLSCTLCLDGQAPEFPSRVVTLPGTDVNLSCSRIDQFLQGLSAQADPRAAVTCSSLRVVASHECGCENFLCNVQADPCPSQFRGDGTCGSRLEEELCGIVIDQDDTGEGRRNQDCLDCDPCPAYSFTSCEKCTEQSGCFWCPLDAQCTSYIGSLPESCPLEDHIGILTSCADFHDNSTNVFDDPLYDSTGWVFELINIEPVWRQGITGAGIHVRVNDDGVDVSHPEFAGKFDIDASCADNYLPININADTHGTAVASIIAGNANNDLCSLGIAPGSTLSSCRSVGKPGDPTAPFPQLLTMHLDKQDVSSNSYSVQSCQPKSRDGRTRRLQECPFRQDLANSPCSLCDFSNPDALSETCINAIASYCQFRRIYEIEPSCVKYLEHFAECNFFGLPDDFQSELVRGIQEGRGGKGLLFVFSSGNKYSSGADVNFNGVQNSRFVITVGAVGKQGLHASYSTPGAALLLTAPGGDIEFPVNWITAKPGGTCGDSSIGTSWSAPVVSGVIALMLQVAPNLSWRDVYSILASTARQTDTLDDSWGVNSAGFHHSNKYGFGIVDAHAAVEAARQWENLPQEIFLSTDTGRLDIPITDDPDTPVVSTLSLEEAIVIESVVIYLELTHGSRGHLKITLTSPGGTESVLTPGERPENGQLVGSDRWKLMTVRNFGETSAGTWTLSVVDIKAGDFGDCVDLPVVFVDDNGEFGCRDIDPSTCDLPNAPLSIREGCCMCGGGQDPAETMDALNSWRLVVYGHSTTSTQPEPSPETAPPVQSGSLPTFGPTRTRTRQPTPHDPTLRPTRRNLISRRPSEAPTAQPTTTPAGSTLTTTTTTGGFWSRFTSQAPILSVVVAMDLSLLLTLRNLGLL